MSSSGLLDDRLRNHRRLLQPLVLRLRLKELGAPDQTLELWFAQTLRDAFALSHAGGYRPLKELLSAELPRTLASSGVDADSQAISRVVSAFAELEPEPCLGEALELWLVAAHSWDVAGAVMAGLLGAYVTPQEGSYLAASTRRFTSRPPPWKQLSPFWLGSR
jgi:hypothetical protein